MVVASIQRVGDEPLPVVGKALLQHQLHRVGIEIESLGVGQHSLVAAAERGIEIEDRERRSVVSRPHGPVGSRIDALDRGVRGVGDSDVDRVLKVPTPAVRVGGAREHLAREFLLDADGELVGMRMDEVGIDQVLRRDAPAQEHSLLAVLVEAITVEVVPVVRVEERRVLVREVRKARRELVVVAAPAHFQGAPRRFIEADDDPEAGREASDVEDVAPLRKGPRRDQDPGGAVLLRQIAFVGVVSEPELQRDPRAHVHDVVDEEAELVHRFLADEGRVAKPHLIRGPVAKTDLDITDGSRDVLDGVPVPLDAELELVVRAEPTARGNR